MNNKSKRIILIGPYPAPIGGVSIHIKRLSEMLISQGVTVVNIDESPQKKKDIYNFRSLNLIKYFQILISANIIHIHSSITLFRIYHLLFCIILRKKTVVTLHSWRCSSSILKQIERFLFSKIDTVVCVNDLIKNKVSLDNTIVQYAFLPPKMEAEPILPPYVLSWISHQKKRGAIIISANAYRLDEFNNQDL